MSAQCWIFTYEAEWHLALNPRRVFLEQLLCRQNLDYGLYFNNFLAFEVASRHFQYVCYPFVLGTFPQDFIEICILLKALARQTWSVSVSKFLDDWLLFSVSANVLAAVMRAFVQIYIHLGLGVNLEKAYLTFAGQLIHNGFVFKLPV